MALRRLACRLLRNLPQTRGRLQPAPSLHSYRRAGTSGTRWVEEPQSRAERDELLNQTRVSDISVTPLLGTDPAQVTGNSSGVALVSPDLTAFFPGSWFSKEGPRHHEGEWIVRAGVAGGFTGGGWGWWWLQVILSVSLTPSPQRADHLHGAPPRPPRAGIFGIWLRREVTVQELLLISYSCVSFLHQEFKRPPVCYS